MTAWWVGTVSTVIGAVVGAVLQAWREQLGYRRQLSARWDAPLFDGLKEYLATADRAVRALLRWRQVRAEGGDVPGAALVAEDAFESLHEKSQIIALLSGDREDPVRASAREMRQVLLPLCAAMRDDRLLSDDETRELVHRHHRARAQLLRESQRRLGRAGTGS